VNEPHKNAASRYLLSLAERNAQAYIALPGTRAIILVGSAAEGVSDYHSDIDMCVFYDALPSEEALLAACQQNQGDKRQFFGEPGQEAGIEIYHVNGVECQIVHTTIGAWERDMATVLEQLDVTSPLQKALSGMLVALPLYGEALVRQWQEKLSHYPDALAQAMVKHYMAIVPVWAIQERMQPRDATIWLNQLLVEASYQLLGILAGLNRLYYSSFQFKRMHHFVAQMKIAPPDLATRLEALFHSDIAIAATQLEELTREVVELVEQHMPQVDVTALRSRIGWRQQSWQPGPSVEEK